MWVGLLVLFQDPEGVATSAALAFDKRSVFGDELGVRLCGTSVSGQDLVDCFLVRLPRTMGLEGDPSTCG